MASRGRKSAASLAVVPALPNRRPEPPRELTNEQAIEWRAVVGYMPADWFTRETHALLVQYCRHVVNARRIARALDGYDPAVLATPEGIDTYDKLAKMADREGRALANLATRMRLTQQSHYRPDKSVGKASAADEKPWEFVA